jgi:hypothetical protein
LNKKNIILALALMFLMPLLLMPSMLQAEEFESPEAFTEYIYTNYAGEDFAEVYDNFAAELKRILEENEYVEFQKENFEKYNLKYSEIEVAQAEEIEFDKIKEQFSYADDFGKYFKLQVNYLLEFDRFGSRQEESGKMVYLRKIKDDFQIFWDHQSALKDDKAADRDDSNE